MDIYHIPERIVAIGGLAIGFMGGTMIGTRDEIIGWILIACGVLIVVATALFDIIKERKNKKND